MKVLMMSLDGSIFSENSASARRMRLYGNLIEELHIIVPDGRGGKKQLSENVTAYPAGSFLRPFCLIKAYLAGKKILKAGGKWIITAQDPFEMGFIAWWLAKKFNTELEIQMHGDFYGNSYWRKECPLNYFRYFLGKYILRRAGSIRVVSRRIAESLLFLSNKNIFEAPIFFDSEEWPVRENKKISEYFIIFAAGNLVPVKNHKLLIEAFAEIKKELSNVKLVIAGDGPLLKNLRFMISDLRLENDVELIGHKNNLADYYSSADIFVHPSLYEGWGRAVVEAAYYGLPIIMSDVGLAGEIIKNGESGIIVPVNNKDALKNAILKLAEDKELRKRLGEGAKHVAGSFLTKEAAFDRIKKNWEAIMDV